MAEKTVIFKNKVLNPKITHAELEALLKLDAHSYPNVKNYTLYATAEPCPMCMGLIVMSNFRKLKVAARDSYCGKTHWCENDPYIVSKEIKVEFETGTFEIILPSVGLYLDLKNNNGKLNDLAKSYAKDNPIAYETAKVLYADRRLDEYVINKTPFSEVFNDIATISNYKR